jgi:hypothetical protein
MTRETLEDIIRRKQDQLRGGPPPPTWPEWIGQNMGRFIVGFIFAAGFFYLLGRVGQLLG